MDGEDRCGAEDCGLPIAGPSGSVLQCTVRTSCRRLFHVGCAGLSPSDFEKLRKRALQKSWTCSDCGGEELDERPRPDPELPLCAICCRNLLPSDEGDVLHCPSCALPSHRKCSDIKDAAWRRVIPLICIGDQVFFVFLLLLLSLLSLRTQVTQVKLVALVAQLKLLLFSNFFSRGSPCHGEAKSGIESSAPALWNAKSRDEWRPTGEGQTALS